MPFDGISFNEAGYKITLPSEMNIHTAMASDAEAKNFIKKLNEAQAVEPDGRSKKDANANSKKENRKKQDDEEEEEKSFIDENSPEFIKHAGMKKKYRVSFNYASDMVELIERQSGKVIETISPNELMEIISKSKTASGVLVDRTV